MINRVVLVGRLTKDPELKYTNSNIGVASFTLAVNRNFVGKDEVKADFIPCVAWDIGKYKQAENVAKYLHKGSLCGVDGRIQTRNYEASDGTRRYITEVIADNVRFLDSKPKDDEHKQYDNSKQNIPEHLKPNHEKSDDPFFASSNIDIEEDDLPF
jgi:single-strand DNA-binding protein